MNGGWCKIDEYRCPTDVCIPVAKVCDGQADCTDYSDEIGCNRSKMDSFAFLPSDSLRILLAFAAVVVR